MRPYLRDEQAESLLTREAREALPLARQLLLYLDPFFFFKDASVGTVWSSLVSEFPELSAYERSISCAVNADYSRFTAAVADGDEVAFLPPVSGG